MQASWVTQWLGPSSVWAKWSAVWRPNLLQVSAMEKDRHADERVTAAAHWIQSMHHLPYQDQPGMNPGQLSAPSLLSSFWGGGAVTSATISFLVSLLLELLLSLSGTLSIVIITVKTFITSAMTSLQAPLLIEKPLLLPHTCTILQPLSDVLCELRGVGSSIRQQTGASNEIEAGEVGVLRIPLHRQFCLNGPSGQVFSRSQRCWIHLVKCDHQTEGLHDCSMNVGWAWLTTNSWIAQPVAVVSQQRVRPTCNGLQKLTGGSNTSNGEVFNHRLLHKGDSFNQLQMSFPAFITEIAQKTNICNL